jgi:two-component system chemotaxis sensor kinase CheA
MNEFVEQFLIECRELVEQGSEDLLALERDPADQARLDSAFRAFHTLKGSAGIIDFNAMARGLGAAEDVLALVRTGERPVTADLVGDCLACLDQVVRWLDELEASGDLPAEAETQADALQALFTRRSPGRGPEALPAIASPASTTGDELPGIARDLLAAQVAMLAEASGAGLAGCVEAAARVSVNVLRSFGRSRNAKALEAARDESLVAKTADALAGTIQSLLSETTLAPLATGDLQTNPSAASVRTLRVDIDRIDALVRLAGELTVTKNAIGHALSGAGSGQGVSAHLRAQHAQLDRLVGELQRSVLTIRVLPLRQVFQRFPRLVREVGATLGKPVRLVLQGEEVEADKVIVEALFEPLLHVLRNAVDHGIEDAAGRAAAGKPALAEVRLTASRQGDRVLVEIADDGRGVDVERVREIARSRGVASDDALARMSDTDIVDLVFAPGFSTASAVTDLSGRGVGMDAVRVAIERLGGHVALESRAGVGTTVRFALPFTLVMAPVMTVEAGGQTFGVPLASVVETVRVPQEWIAGVGAARAFVLRDQTLPLCHLGDMLGLGRADTEHSAATVVVVDLGDQLCGLKVDRAGECMDVMLKPLEGLLSGIPGLAGTTVLGDGRVLIVLDVAGLFA